MIEPYDTSTLMPFCRLLTLSALLVLGGCASHYPYPVEVEDRSRGELRGNGEESSTGDTVQPGVEPVDSGVRVYPTDEGTGAAPAVTPSQDSAAESSSAESVSPAARPAGTAQPASVPQGALLALLEKAEQQHQAGQTQQALSSLERAQRIAPRAPLIYLQQARLRRDLGDKSAAEQLARKGLSLSSGNPEMQKAFQALLQTLTP